MQQKAVCNTKLTAGYTIISHIHSLVKYIHFSNNKEAPQE